ncbi:MAG: phosphate signaling complex protein PhoU [Candidatus Spyradenecus sp.]
MRDRFTYEIETLKQHLLDLATAAENALIHAMRAVDHPDADSAREIIARDAAIDADEVTIEEECLKLMALYQPVAGDLRLLVTILKVNGELERVADLASNIASRAIDIASITPPPAQPFDFTPMLSRAHKMLRGALDAFVCHRSDQARTILLEDDAVDALNAAHYADARERLLKNPAQAGYTLDCVTISHAIERIADIATNICEDVIYLEEGQIVRHARPL